MSGQKSKSKSKPVILPLTEADKALQELGAQFGQQSFDAFNQQQQFAQGLQGQVTGGGVVGSLVGQATSPFQNQADPLSQSILQAEQARVQGPGVGGAPLQFGAGTLQQGPLGGAATAAEQARIAGGQFQGGSLNLGAQQLQQSPLQQQLLGAEQARAAQGAFNPGQGLQFGVTPGDSRITPDQIARIQGVASANLGIAGSDISDFAAQQRNALITELTPSLGLRPGDTPIQDRGFAIGAEATRQFAQASRTLQAQALQAELDLPLAERGLDIQGQGLQLQGQNLALQQQGQLGGLTLQGQQQQSALNQQLLAQQQGFDLAQQQANLQGQGLQLEQQAGLNQLGLAGQTAQAQLNQAALSQEQQVALQQQQNQLQAQGLSLQQQGQLGSLQLDESARNAQLLGLQGDLSQQAFNAQAQVGGDLLGTAASTGAALTAPTAISPLISAVKDPKVAGTQSKTKTSGGGIG